jgi:5'(3')-deoxyribonucleotidase
MKSGNLNFLEHSGPLQACNGTAFYMYQLTARKCNNIADYISYPCSALRETSHEHFFTDLHRCMSNSNQALCSKLHEMILRQLYCNCESRHNWNNEYYVIISIQYVQILRGGGGVVVKALRYKPAGHGFDSRWCHWNSSVTLILPVALWP